MDTKRWWESKTIWLNVLAIVFVVLQEVGAGDVGLDPQIKLAVVAIVNLLLRFFFTDKKVARS